MNKEVKNMNFYVLLARQAIENYIKEGKIISPTTDLAEEFLIQGRAGTFVTIEKNGNLRGCIGTYLPTRVNIAEEIIHNAIAAATEDYRFGPIKKEELPELSYTVYILSAPELVGILGASTSRNYENDNIRRLNLQKISRQLNPKKYGIIVKTAPISPSGDVIFNGYFVAKTGLLLPNLETVDTVEKQILIACQKRGINPLKEKILIYRFTVEKFE